MLSCPQTKEEKLAFLAKIIDMLGKLSATLPLHVVKVITHTALITKMNEMLRCLFELWLCPAFELETYLLLSHH